jgi:hypothetical protein
MRLDYLFEPLPLVYRKATLGANYCLLAKEANNGYTLLDARINLWKRQGLETQHEVKAAYAE